MRGLASLFGSGSRGFAINSHGQIVGLSNHGAYRLDPIPPRLAIQPTATNMILSWTPAWPGLILEATDSLSFPDWQPLDTGGTNVIQVPLDSPNRFFRLDTSALAGLCCAPE